MEGVWSVVTGHGGYLAFALATHALVGAVLGKYLFDKPLAGAVGAVIADVDLLFPATWEPPLVHRGITHTPLVAGITVAFAATRGLALAGAIGVGYASQLLIDVTTPKGIPLAFPLTSQSVTVPIGGHSPPVTAALWISCLLALYRLRTDGD